MVRSTSIAVLLLSLASFNVQAQDARVVTRVVTDTLPAWKTWKTNAGSMNYPGSWAMDAEAKGDTVVVFRKVAMAPGAPLVCLVITEGKEQPASPSKELKRLSGKDLQVIASTGPDDAGAYSIEFTGIINGVSHHGLRKVQVSEGRTYVLSYLAASEAYAEHLFLAEAMMNSFSLPAGR